MKANSSSSGTCRCGSAESDARSKIAQLADHFLGEPRILTDKCRDRVERVEEKVRTQARFHVGQLRTREIRLERGRALLARHHRVVVHDGLIHEQDRRVAKHVAGESRREPIDDDLAQILGDRQPQRPARECREQAVNADEAQPLEAERSHQAAGGLPVSG